MQIRKAERRKAKLRLGITGPSGSGKTWSALTIATGMGGKIGLIDTEAGRGELYGNDFDYDIIRIDAPYSPQRFIQAITMFEKEGYDILIIDSISHAWNGQGGILTIVDNAGGQFQNAWKKATPIQNAFIDKIVTSNLHIISTFRAKTEYVVEQNEKGKAAPRKVGLAPVQRDGVEYEFTMFMNINQDHVAHITKDNTRMYDQEFVTPTEEMGAELMQWLNQGAEPIKVEPPQPPQRQPAPVKQPSKPLDQAIYSMHYDLIKEAMNLDDLKTRYHDAKKALEGYRLEMTKINKLTQERKELLQKAAEAVENTTLTPSLKGEAAVNETAASSSP